MTNDQPGPPDDHPAAEGKDNPQVDGSVDGPTVMGPTVGHLTRPTPGTPDQPPPNRAGAASGNSSLDDPTVAGPALSGPPPNDPTIAGSWSTWPPHQHPGTPTPPPADEQTVADTSGPPFAPPQPDEQTVYAARSGPSPAPPPSEEPTVGKPGEPTLATTPSDPSLAAPAPEEPTVGWLGATYLAPSPPEEPTVTRLGEPPAEPTITTTPSAVPPQSEEPAITGLGVGSPVDEATVRVDGPTVAISAEDATTTGPTIGGWPFDEPEPPPLPTDLVWRADPPPSPDEQREPRRSPAYYIGLGAAVVVVVGLVAFAAVVSVVKPTSVIAGSAHPTQGIPEITTTTPNQPPATTTTVAPEGPLAEVAKHPLSTWQGRMADVTCELPRFDPADDRQAAFYAAAKVCADNAWRGVLAETRLESDVKVVTVTSTVQTPSCGEVDPTSPATQCDGTVYMTPAHLRDTEQNGRYPGRYLGVFLREYARALQFTTGLAELAGNVTTGAAEDLDKRLGQQATCLAGVVSGAMSGRGAIDGNITGEISARLSAVDAPPDAKAWLDKGFQARQPSACNTWTG